MKAVINGQFVAVMAPVSNLPKSAAGVFETVLWREGAPQFWDEHWSRFAAGGQWFGLAPAIGGPAMRDLAFQITGENRITNGLVRYAAWRSANGSTSWTLEADGPRPHMGRESFTATWGPPLPAADEARAFKHLARGPWFDALVAARAAGFDEVLLTDAEDRLVEGGISNVFIVRSGVLHTPALPVGPLPGVMRGAVIALQQAAGLEVRETVLTRHDVEQADEVWLTNSLIGVKPVRQVQHRTYPSPWPRFEALRSAWRAKYGWDPARPCG